MTDVAGDVWNWCKENPVLAAGIAATSVVAIAAVGYGVYSYNANRVNDPNSSKFTGILYPTDDGSAADRYVAVNKAGDLLGKFDRINGNFVKVKLPG